ncbi:MAG: hypothetical protein ACK4TA_14090 [Saprospiraceae bacterium]
MKTLTSIDLFVQALLIFGILGTGATAIFNVAYVPFFLLLLLATGIWQLASAMIGTFYHQDKYKPVYLAASVIYCCFLVFLSSPQHSPFGDRYTQMAQVTFIGIIPVIAALIYFYICVLTYDQYLEAKKEGEFV